MLKFTTYLGLFMGIFFICAGLYLIVSPPDSQDFKVIREYNVLFGFLVIMYGAFRLYRSYLQWKEMQK